MENPDGEGKKQTQIEGNRGHRERLIGFWLATQTGKWKRITQWQYMKKTETKKILKLGNENSPMTE